MILALMAVQMMWAAPYTVTNTSDDVEKEGSLRWACNQASSNKSVEITFDIEGDGNKVIKLTNQIQIQGTVTIDARSSKDSIIIDANDMEFSDYCFYLNNDKTTKLSLKGLVLKNKKTSAIYSYTYNDSENTLDVLIDSCFLYSSITTYGGNFVIKKSSVFSNVIASYSTSTSLEIVDCEFVDCQHAYCCLLSADIAKFICSRTTFNRKIVDGSNPIHYNSQSIYSAPVIDTAYVKNGMLFVKGHVASEEIVDIELFSACGSYDPKSSHNRYDCTKYIGATKTNSKGIFSCELTLPEKGVKTKQHFVLSATATYSKAHTSSFAFYDVIQPYWVVTNTEAGSVIYASPVGSMGWACYFAGTNDTIAFDFPGKGTKEIEGNDVFSTNAFVDGSTYADTIILHGLECRNVNKIVSQNSTKINGFYVSEKITNCIARGNSKGITISSPDCYIENCIAENNTDAGISTSVGGKARVIKNSVVRNNKVGIGCGARLIENCEITNNSEKGIAAASNTYDIDTIRGCLISGNDIGIDGDIIFIENNIIGLTKDQKQAMPNRIGINSGKYKSIGIILNNVISGNKEAGVFWGGHSFSTFKNNYVGTNRYLDMNPSFGNGGDGLHIEATISKDQEFSNNHIMNNGGAGLYVNVVNGTIENCSFSNNKKEGVRVTGSFSGVFKKCNFEGNEKEGLYSDASGSTYVVDSCDFSRNGTYGLYMSQCNFDLTNSTFDSNKGTAFVYDITKYNATTSLLSDNKFLHTNKAYPAFKTTNPYPVPEFTSCKMTKTTIVIEGKIDTAAIAKIELFYTSQGEQTAEMLVDSFYTNPDGTFSDTLDRSMFVGKSVISFNATATYGKITSPLSDLVSPSLGRVDLASTEFYVKMDGYGDGSSWENAMNLQTFIYYLPQVMNGSTFYVAEGRYVPTSKGFRINSSVSIVGGFSPDATSGAVADPVRYKTVFTGDPSGDDTVVEDQYLSDPSNDDVIFSEFDGHLFSAGNFDVHISGCELSGTRSSINRVPAISCGNLYLTNCTFEKTGIINGLDKKKVVADGCIFRNLIKGYTPSGLFEQDSVYVNNSVFENLQGLASTCFDRSLSIVDIRNSIFKNIKNGKSIFYSTKNVYLYNNLFVGVSQVNNETNFLLVKDTAVIIGNIFKDCDYENLVNTTDHTFIKHNLCEKILGTDDDINTGDLADFVVDGVYNKTTGTFVPTYSDWGGYVPTIVTKSDTLPDGRSIRFSLNETKVLTDQRSVSRLPKTCMGAYEIGCGSDTTFSTDTINVGTKIYGQTFTKVGVHDSIFETLQNAMGCDSVVMHKVVVKPDPTKLNYYVKMDKEGRGDGSDWDNAMDSTDFATYLPLAPDGATFYVAAGTYKPKFDKNLSPCKNPLACYTINSDVTILGGFPENATLKENPSSDPFKNITRFSGDLFGNDEFIYQNEEPGAKLLNIKNQEENVTSIFILTSPSEVKFNGIFISESPFVHGAINSSEIVSLTIENSCFEKNDGHIVVLTNPSELGKFTINNCKLVSNGVRSGGGSGVIFDMSCPIDAKKLTLKGNRLYSIFKSTKSLTADSIEIEDCVAEYGFLGNSSEENAELKHWIVKENKIRYFSMNVSNLTIDSSSFVSDSVSYFTANAKSLKISNSEIDSNHVEYDMYSGVNNLELYSTELKENHASRFFIGSGSTLSIDKCGFYSNDYDNYMGSSILNATIQNSSFIRNVSSSSTEAFLSIDKLALTNNTFANNKSINLIQMNGADLQNNTFVGNSTKQSILYAYSSGGTYNIEGNIIIGNQSDNNIFINVGYATNYSFSNNVMPLYSKVVKRESCTNVPDLTTNVVYSTDQLEGMTACETIDYSTLKKEKDILSILSGSFDSDEFIPELKNNGGFTPTVALKSDKLSDGTSIRFPRLENVLTDQRGVERLDSTCMGAYELGCVNDTTFTTDTIYVGDKILGQTFTKVGVHDSIFETLKSSLDCDSVVMHRVVVKPDPNTFNYYVKMDKEGRGDGSDWDNAMDSTDFATYLPLAPDGAVFYVAAGEYKPVYDINGNVSAWPLYNVNSSISIYGGFPADATGKEVPSEPDKYKTVLGYDVNCSFALFYSEKNELLSFVLDGVYVNDYCSYVIKMPSVDLTLRNSYFEGNSNFCDVSNEGSLNVVNTEFSKTQYTLFSMYGTKSVYMEDVKFVENIPSSYFYGDGYDVILKSVNATNNNGYYYFIGSKKLLVENSEFTKNSTGSYLLTTSGTVDIQNSLFDQNEGSMLINSDLSYEDSYINISKSKFSNNTTSSPVIYGARSSINCTLTESEFSNNNCYDLLFLIGSDYLTINDC